MLRNLGLEGSKAKPPGFKADEKELALREKEVPIDSQGAVRYRSCVMRLSYLALDRADLGEPVKCLARSMAKPTPGSLRDLKNVARYLLRTKYAALHLWRQTFPKCISTYVDSNFAGCRLTRRSTTGPVWFGTPKTRANTMSMASRTSGSRTSLNTKDHNHAQHCGHSYKDSKQRNIGTTQENNWTKTCQRTQ